MRCLTYRILSLTGIIDGNGPTYHYTPSKSSEQNCKFAIIIITLQVPVRKSKSKKI